MYKRVSKTLAPVHNLLQLAARGKGSANERSTRERLTSWQQMVLLPGATRANALLWGALPISPAAAIDNAPVLDPLGDYEQTPRNSCGRRQPERYLVLQTCIFPGRDRRSCNLCARRTRRD